VARLELYGAARCPYTQEMRDWLEFSRRDFEGFDVEADPAARSRLYVLDSTLRRVPVLVEDGKVVQVGWQGRSCPVE